jgi:hypothetical protein
MDQGYRPSAERVDVLSFNYIDAESTATLRVLGGVRPKTTKPKFGGGLAFLNERLKLFA